MEPVFSSVSASCQDSTLITVEAFCSKADYIVGRPSSSLAQNEKLIQSVHKAGEKINIHHGSDFSKSNFTSLTKQKSVAK